MNNAMVSIQCTRVLCAVEVIAEAGTYLLMFNNMIVGQETPETPSPRGIKVWDHPARIAPTLPTPQSSSYRRTAAERVALQEQILNFFTDRPGKAFTSRRVADALMTKTPADRHAVSVALKELRVRGTLKVLSDIRYPEYTLATTL
jgi:hypothetical protein